MSSNKFFSSWKLALATAVVSFGLQSPAQALVGVSVKGGVGMSKTNDTGSKYALGFLGGLGFDFGAGPVTIGVDALFAMRSLGFDVGTSKFNQLHVPVMAKLSLAPTIYLGAGGYYSMALSDTGTFYDTNGNEVGTVTITNKTDYGIVGGLGASFGGISVEGRYNYSLGDFDGSHIEALVGFKF